MRISDWSSDVCSSDLPEGIVRDFPGVAVGVGEVAGVAAPVGLFRRLQDGGARRRGLLEDGVHLGLVAGVVGQREAAEALAGGGGGQIPARVLRQILPAPEGADRAAQMVKKSEER